MARLKYSNCSSTFDKKALVTYTAVDLAHAGAGIGWGRIIWPLALRMHAGCPSANKNVCSRFLILGVKIRLLRNLEAGLIG